MKVLVRQMKAKFKEMAPKNEDDLISLCVHTNVCVCASTYIQIFTCTHYLYTQRYFQSTKNMFLDVREARFRLALP